MDYQRARMIQVLCLVIAIVLAAQSTAVLLGWWTP